MTVLESTIPPAVSALMDVFQSKETLFTKYLHNVNSLSAYFSAYH
jgi:hypothetical protein